MQTRHLALCLSLCFLSTTAAQQPPPGNQPTFRADVAVVEVAAVVVDKGGNPIGDLTADDFEVFENGAHRPLVSMRLLVSTERQQDHLAASVADARVETLATATLSSGTGAGALLREMMGGTVSQGHLPMRVQVIPEFAAGREGRAMVIIDPATADEQAVEVLAAVDDDGKMGSPQAFRLAPPGADVADGNGWTFTTPLTLARGGHQVRVAAATADGTRSGLVIAPVEIAEPGNRLLMAPPVLLGTMSDAQVAPTLARTFDAGMPIGVQAEVAGRPVRDRRVTMAAALRNARGEIVREVDAVLDAGSRPDRARATALSRRPD